MRRHLPTALAGLALFISLGGTSIAAISFARNAGAVDGQSATSGKASLSTAAGKLVATNGEGRFNGRFLDGVSHDNTFTALTPVNDNAASAPTALTGFAKVGTLSNACTDQNAQAGVEDPLTTLTFTNTSATTVNFTGRAGAGGANIVPMAPATTQAITIRGSNTFSIQAAIDGVDLRFTGTVRQDGAGTPDAQCLVYGTLTRVD